MLITGASTGIGKAAALHFAAKGWNVAATMRTPDHASAWAPAGGSWQAFALDVTVPDSIEKAVAAVIERFGAIDCLVNNAGYGLVGAFEASTPEQVEKQFATNVLGLMNVTRAVLPHMRERKSGHIINVSSVAGLVPIPFAGQYSASKYALEGLTEVPRSEVALFGIRVALVEPGFYRSELVGAAATPEREHRYYGIAICGSKKAVNRLTGMLPLLRA